MRGLRQKLDALHVLNGPSPSKYEGFRRKLVCCNGISFFLNYLNSRLFVQSICTIQSHILKYQHFLTSLSIFQSFNDLFWAKWTKNWKALEMNSEDVETLHGIIISLTKHVLKSWEGYGKNWLHFVYKLDHLLRSMRVSDENSSVAKAFHFFKLIWIPDFLCNQYAPFKATS